MADKTITDRWKSVQAIASAVYQNDDKAAANLAELFMPDLEDGEQLPDWKLDQHLKVRRLERLWKALDASHDALAAKRHEHKRLRRVLDDASDAVYSRLLSLKRVLSGIRPRRGSQPRWLKGKLPRANNPYKLHQGALVARGSLQEMEPARSETGGFDPEAWSKALETEAKALDRAIDDETLARREVEGLEDERHRCLTEFGDGFVRIAGELEALYKLAGMDHVARMVQPSKKYPGRTMVEIRHLGKAGRGKRSQAPEDDEQAS